MQELVVETRAPQGGIERPVGHFVMAEQLQEGGVLVAQDILDGAILCGLQPRGGTEHMPELGVFAGRQGLQDAPLLEQLTLDLFHPREDLEARVEVGRRGCARMAARSSWRMSLNHSSLVWCWMMNKQLVVVRRIAQGPLRVQERVEAQVLRIGLPAGQIAVDPGFEVPLQGVVVGHGDGKCVARRQL